MTDHPSALDAAVRAIGGESDLDVVVPALEDWRLAQVIAFAPDAHHLVRAIAALCGDLPAALDSATIAAPAVHGAVARLIGTCAGRTALHAWAEVAPAGRGNASAAALIDAVRRSMCNAGAAAALIGPCDDSAALLHVPHDAAFAIRSWGQSIPNDPTAWTNEISAGERRRVLDAVQRVPSAIASCLPWLPPNIARAAGDAIPVRNALDAFAAASPTVRARHTTRVRRLVARVHPADLDALTRLACAMGAKTVWRRVQTLIRTSPDDARRVVAAAPWNTLPGNVRHAIMTCADRSPVCAAIAAARGAGTPGMPAPSPAAAFFGALDPAVWDAMDADARFFWSMALRSDDLHLIIRALGLRPEILARAPLDANLVRAAQRHARDDAAWRAALFPVALRDIDLVAAHALITALPTMPRDAGAFVAIASRCSDPETLAVARTALHTRADIETALVLRRFADPRYRTSAACALLQHALHGRTRDDLKPILPLLPDVVRNEIAPAPAALVDHLAHPDRRDAMRAMLARIASLPQEISVPAHVALHRWTTRRTHAHDAADALASALRGHGDVFLAMMDALTDALRAAVLPLPEDPARARALRALVRDHPVYGRTLACALHTRSWRNALEALLYAPPAHADAIWRTLAHAQRRAVARTLPAGAEECALRAGRDSVADLALAALQSSDPSLRDAGVAALAQRTEILRARWDALPPEVRQTLRGVPAVAVAVADRDAPSPTAQGDHRRRLCRR